MHVQALIPILQFCSYSAPDWPTVKLLHDLQVVFSDPSMCFKTGNSHCQIIIKGKGSPEGKY